MALIAYLKSGKLTPPVAVTSAKTENPKQVGFIWTNFRHGSLLLRNAKGEVIRLAWTSPSKMPAKDTDDAKPKIDHRRPLPPGKYTLLGYRLHRTDDHGRPWHVAMTTLRGRTIDVQAGKSQKVNVPLTVSINLGTRWNKKGLGITAGITGAKRGGLTIYREGRRIPIGYEIHDAKGLVLASGAMRYG